MDTTYSFGRRFASLKSVFPSLNLLPKNFSFVVKFTKGCGDLNTATLDLHASVAPPCNVWETVVESSPALKQFKLESVTFQQSSLLQSLLVSASGLRDLQDFLQSGAPLKRATMRMSAPDQ